MPTEKAIKDPNTLMEYFNRYKKDTKENPRIVYEYHGKDGEQRLKPLERPLTHEGFLNWCWAVEKHDINAYYYNLNNDYAEYLSTITRIKELIRQDQIEGGQVGQYNPNLTARYNGLKETTENTNNTNITLLNIDPLDDSKDKI